MKVKTLEEIAREEVGFKSLETKNDPAHDERTVSVWQMRRALEVAYAQGFQAADRTAREAAKAPPAKERQ